MLFVPGNRPDLAAKATRADPDVVVLDLEDAVPPAAKADARATTAEAATDLVTATAVCVRVNPPSTRWFADDVASLADRLTAVVVPKLESAAQLVEVADALGGRPVVAGIETVRGVADAREVLGPPVVACYFGAEDYVADLGGVRTADNAEVAYARAYVAMAARLAGVPALDMVTLDFGDDERFVAEAHQARGARLLGQAVHPPGPGVAGQPGLPPDRRRDRLGRPAAGGLRPGRGHDHRLRGPDGGRGGGQPGLGPSRPRPRTRDRHPESPEVLWVPPADVRQSTVVGRYLDWLAHHRGLEFSTYPELWQWSVDDLAGFWSSVWSFFDVQADQPYTDVLADATMPGARWFPGARLNYAARALATTGSRHRGGGPLAVGRPRASTCRGTSWPTWCRGAGPGSAGSACARATVWWPTCPTVPRPWWPSWPPPAWVRSGRRARPSSGPRA